MSEHGIFIGEYEHLSKLSGYEMGSNGVMVGFYEYKGI